MGFSSPSWSPFSSHRSKLTFEAKTDCALCSMPSPFLRQHHYVFLANYPKPDEQLKSIIIPLYLRMAPQLPPTDRLPAFEKCHFLPVCGRDLLLRDRRALLKEIARHHLEVAVMSLSRFDVCWGVNVTQAPLKEGGGHVKPREMDEVWRNWWAETNWFWQESSPTVVGEVLGQVEESERHQDVEGPVDAGSAGVTRAPRPQRVDLRVDGPRHGTHPWEEESRKLKVQIQHWFLL